MERRFAVRKREMLAECEVSRRAFCGMVERLVEFVEPFAACLGQPAQREHARKYVMGLLSDLKRKNVESIAYRHDEDRRNLQHFIGTAEWDPRPLVRTLVAQVGDELGEADAVIVFDPSAFRKKGRQSVGVARQWCGRYGKIDNCQVAVYMAYVARDEHVLVDTRLYLPEEWASDRRRKKAAGVPKGVRFQTRHQQALEMLREHREKLSHGWIAGDDEMGRSTVFRRDLRVMAGFARHGGALHAGRSVQHDDPGPSGPAACLPRTWSETETSVRAVASLARIAFRGRLDAHPGARRRKGPAGSGHPHAPRRGEDRSASRRPGGDVRGHPLVGRAGRGEARLLSLQRAERYAACGVRSRGPGGASRRGVHQTSQERSRPGRLRSSQLGCLATPSGALAHGRVVPGPRGPTGKKNARRR